MSATPYVPPTVWRFDSNNGGKFANINRPTAGATHEMTLRKGQHDLQLYSLATPNGQKVTVMLEAHEIGDVLHRGVLQIILAIA